MPINNIFNLVFSLGAACSCANTLKGMGLRNMSSPFDWLYGSSFEARIDLLLNNFENFMNKEDLIYSGKQESISCDIYKNTRTNITFNHDFISNIPFDTSYTMVKSKYDRRIKRLLELIDKASSLLIVYMDIPNTKPLETDIVIEKHKEISAKYPHKNIEIYYIKLSTQEESIQRFSDDKITVITTDYKSKEENAQNWHVDFKHLIKYFKDIKII